MNRSVERMVFCAVIFVLAIVAIIGWKHSDGVIAAKEQTLQQRDAEISEREKLLEKSEGTVVYAVMDIPAGAEFTAESIMEKKVPLTRVPVDAIQKESLIIGRVSKFGIPAGQAVSQHDLEAILQPGVPAEYLRKSDSDQDKE